jgi:hypothetical protein
MQDCAGRIIVFLIGQGEQIINYLQISRMKQSGTKDKNNRKNIKISLSVVCSKISKVLCFVPGDVCHKKMMFRQKTESANVY